MTTDKWGLVKIEYLLRFSLWYTLANKYRIRAKAVGDKYGYGLSETPTAISFGPRYKNIAWKTIKPTVVSISLFEHLQIQANLLLPSRDLFGVCMLCLTKEDVEVHFAYAQISNTGTSRDWIQVRIRLCRFHHLALHNHGKLSNQEVEHIMDYVGRKYNVKVRAIVTKNPKRWGKSKN